MKRSFRLTAALLCIAVTALLCACGDETYNNFITVTPENAPTTTQIAATLPTAAPPVNTTTAPSTPTAPDGSAATETFSPNITYAVGASARVDASYFDDVVFVGDSVSLKLTNYHMSHVCFSVNTAFLTSGSLGVANAMWDLNRADAVHPTYQGELVTVVDGIPKTGKSKVYIMLGTNDLGLYGVEETVANFKTLTDRILAAAPNVTLYVQSVTPLLEDYYSLTNDKVVEYNAIISEYCREKGWYYIDVASVLRDDNGCLIREYCSDPDAMGIHFTDEGCRVWADYLFTHTA